MRKLISLRAALLVALGAALLAVAGASASSDASRATPKPATAAQWSRIVAAAKREGAVTIYSSQNPTYLADMGKRFEQLYGIKVTVNRQIDSVLTQQLNAEHGAGSVKADIFVVATLATALGAQKPNNRWANDAVGPALFAKGFDRKLFAKPAKAAIVGTALLGLAWNTTQWPQGVKNIPDALNARLKGRIGVIAPAAFSIVDWYRWVAENWGANFMQRLAAQEPKIYVSSLPMAQAVASGEITVGTFVATSAIDLKEQGAPIGFLLPKGPKTGTWNAPWYGMVLRRAAHPNAAQLLFNYMFTREGQGLMQKHLGAVLKGVPNTDYVIPRQQSLKESTPDKVAAFQKEWDALFR